MTPSHAPLAASVRETRGMELRRRTLEVERLVRAIADWAAERDDIVGVALVGSWARGTPRGDSDVDLVVLTADKARYAIADDWMKSLFGTTAEIVRTAEWGVLTERRLRLDSGLVVEFGFAPPTWAATDPVDRGTARVVRGGCRPLVDARSVLEGLIGAVQ